MNEVKIVNKSNKPLPAYQTPGSARKDLCADLSNNTREPIGVIEIFPGTVHKIPTGLYMSIPVGYECQVRSRSGLAANHRVVVLNSPGTIDSDYRGEIQVLLMNHGDFTFEVNHGDRIAQLVFNKVEQPTLTLVDELESTERGEGGFGSTGK